MVNYNVFRNKVTATPRAAQHDAPLQIVVERGLGASTPGGSLAPDSTADKQPLASEHVSKLVDEDPAFHKVWTAISSGNTSFVHKSAVHLCDGVR